MRLVADPLQQQRALVVWWQRQRISPAGLTECFDLGYHFKHVDEIFRRVFGG